MGKHLKNDDGDDLEATNELYQDLSSHQKMIKIENERKKGKLAREIEEMGEIFLTEIEIKNIKKEEDRNLLIKLIIKSGNQTTYGDLKVLDTMSNEELESIYIHIKETKKPWYIKLFEMF